MSGCTGYCGSVRPGGGWRAALAVALLALGGSAAARAADIETRDFAVLVSGKPAGEVHMTIHRKDDGTIAMRCDTDIKVSLVVGSYKFIYRGEELWKGGRLLSLVSSTDDNGKRFAVSAQADAAGLRVKVNDIERLVKPNVWLTSYWRLPGAGQRNAQLPLLDADSGKDFEARLGFVGAEKLRVAGQEVVLSHYRVTGPITVDLWYDAAERLVRQEWMEQRHRTVMELLRVRR